VNANTIDAEVTGTPSYIFRLYIRLRFKIPHCEQRAVLLEIPPGRCQSVRYPSVPSATVYRISDTIRRTQSDDGGILLDVHHGQMFCVNVVGCKILELVEKGFDEAEIADHVSRAYVMDIKTVRADVHEFIEVLNKHGVLLIRSAVEAS
jgi:hypothetical protein